jgi:hypothetical protein
VEGGSRCAVFTDRPSRFVCGADDATSCAINVLLTLPLPINVPLIMEVFSTEFRIRRQVAVER